MKGAQVVTVPRMIKNPVTPRATTQSLPLTSPTDTHQAAPTTDREIARPMPRFDHMKGEVSVRNLVWEEGRKRFGCGQERARLGRAHQLSSHPAPAHQSWTSYFPKVCVSEEPGLGLKLHKESGS